MGGDWGLLNINRLDEKGDWGLLNINRLDEKVTLSKPLHVTLSYLF